MTSHVSKDKITSYIDPEIIDIIKKVWMDLDNHEYGGGDDTEDDEKQSGHSFSKHLDSEIEEDMIEEENLDNSTEEIWLDEYSSFIKSLVSVMTWWYKYC